MTWLKRAAEPLVALVLAAAPLVALVLVLAGTRVEAQNGTAYQFPTAPWGGFAPARIQCGRLIGANFNLASSDQAIPIAVPSRYYRLDTIVINNASISLTTAAGGFYTATSQGGVALVSASQAYSTLTGAAPNNSGSAMEATIASAGQNNALNLSAIYLNLSTPQGAAATADIRVFCKPLY